MSFLKKFRRNYLLSEGLNIKLILCLLQPFKTDPLIEVIRGDKGTPKASWCIDGKWILEGKHESMRRSGDFSS